MSREDNFTPNSHYLDPNGRPYAVGPNGRVIFSKISGQLGLPYLVEIQTDSFAWFIEKGIHEVFTEMFPISNGNNTLSIEYVSSRLEEPKYDPLQCKSEGLTYSSKIRVTLRLFFKSCG